MKKKLLLLLVVCLTAVALMASATADTPLTGTCGQNIHWTATEQYGGTYSLRIEWNTEETTDGIITGGWDGLDVSKVTSVDIGSNITKIADKAFAGFTGLTRIYFPYNLNEIGESAFADSTNLEHILCSKWDAVKIASGNDPLLNTMPQNSTACGENVYWYTERYLGVTTMYFKLYAGARTGDVSEITWSDLENKAQISIINFDSGINAICANAFESFTGLTRVDFGYNPMKIGKDAFSDCDNLTAITNWNMLAESKIDEGNDILLKLIKSGGNIVVTGGSCGENLTWELNDEGVLKITGTGAMTSAPWSVSNVKITAIELPNGLTSIVDQAFLRCTQVKTIVLPDTLTEIGESAFYGCTSLRSISVPGSVKDIPKEFLSSSTTDLNIIYVTVNEGTETIGERAFAGCNNLEVIKLPSTLKSIGENAFLGCHALMRVEYNSDKEDWMRIQIANGNECLLSALPFGKINGIEYDIDQETGAMTITGSGKIESAPWLGYSSMITSVTLSDGITSIPYQAFSGATKLVSITIPNSVTSLGAQAFSGCTSLENVTLSKRLSSIAANTFQNCTSLKTITIPDAVTSISANAFDGCSALTTVTTGDFINTVGASAFDNCPDLTLLVPAGSYMETYAKAYDLKYSVIPGTEQSGTTITDITSSAGIDPATNKPCTVITITLSDKTTQRFYLDNSVNSIESVTSARGKDTAGKDCTVVTITLTDGSKEQFYIYDGEDGDDGAIITVTDFADVPANAYYTNAVAWAVANGITTGTGESTFSPNSPCTRAEVVTFLWRAMGSPEPNTANVFSDVSSGSYYAKAVRWAREQGITDGTGGGKFSPGAVCTRAEVVTFLARALGAETGGRASFTDVASGSYYAGPVAWAVRSGITDGTSATTFSPNAGCTRAQIVTFLYRAAA